MKGILFISNLFPPLRAPINPRQKSVKGKRETPLRLGGEHADEEGGPGGGVAQGLLEDGGGLADDDHPGHQAAGKYRHHPVEGPGAHHLSPVQVGAAPLPTAGGGGHGGVESLRRLGQQQGAQQNHRGEVE